MWLNPTVVRTPPSPISSAYANPVARPDWLDLAQASPPYPPAPEVRDHVARFARRPSAAGYTDVPGIPEVRAAVASDLNRSYHASLTQEDITITAGANQAFCVVTDCLTQPGDEVILATPYYFNHQMWLTSRGLRVRHLPAGDDLIPRAERAAELLTSRTRMIVLVSPGNPTGVQISADELGSFGEIAENSGAVLVLDETYRSFTPGGQAPHGLYDRSGWGDHLVTLHSFSKDLAIPGYRVGAIVAGGELSREVHKLLDCLAVCAPRVGQEAVLAGLRVPGWRRDRAIEIADQQAALAAAMSERPGGFALLSQGGFFAWVRHPFPAPTPEVVSRLSACGVLTLTGTAFTPTDTSALRVSVSNLPMAQLPRFVSALQSC